MLSIEPLNQADIPATANLHRQNLRLGLFPKLGRHFLGLYQESFARSPYGIALVARDEDAVVGALFGTTSNAEHYRWVTRNFGSKLALAGCGAMITRPQVALDFARTRAGRYARGVARHIGLLPSVSSASNGAPRPVSVLSHIVTDVNVRRRGIGRRLIEGFADRATVQGVHRALLVTEEGGLGTPFFERLGCRLVGRHKSQDGATLREYRLILDEEGAYEDLDGGRVAYTVVRAYPKRLGAAPSLSQRP
ncbi:GNAT family N-acetyltransferase [Pelagibacterium halotolerans]|uniref:Acetyltransferase, GNAT family protein n=1 Tax=Pelagibacterium halotolerans (strain DSM 22347 / JCM 15775 / CGMCC 1.7692 / B2) TaxID=1082931 RepID=G4RFJ5_PELHB|nr:GNAT family N-acetyltransferase [Pelagibacterium halotolerans]AEQ52997.1 acetyltransferase, GNAT family protein [Pelagibacterium halotolerans B2]QJR17345.1 GNAT family N-acetyltransferase [Pelagibacterium halotolerans]SEA97730.1 Acetyltransferase (GNAT) domain-containing protein [Pelagibacterium halotolerans]